MATTVKDIIFNGSKATFQTGKNSYREIIVITEIPFQVNKTLVLEKWIKMWDILINDDIYNNAGF